MIKGTAIVNDHAGIHARPAAVIAAYVHKCESDVIFRYNGIEVNPGSYIKLMSLKIKCGEEIEIIADGTDEKEVLAELTTILQAV